MKNDNGYNKSLPLIIVFASAIKSFTRLCSKIINEKIIWESLFDFFENLIK